MRVGRTADQVAEVTKKRRHVLGAVSMIVGDAQKRRERRGLIGFLSGAFALVGSYGAGLLVLLFLSTRAV